MKLHIKSWQYSNLFIYFTTSPQNRFWAYLFLFSVPWKYSINKCWGFRVKEQPASHNCRDPRTKNRSRPWLPEARTSSPPFTIKVNDVLYCAKSRGWQTAFCYGHALTTQLPATGCKSPALGAPKLPARLKHRHKRVLGRAVEQGVQHNTAACFGILYVTLHLDWTFTWHRVPIPALKYNVLFHTARGQMPWPNKPMLKLTLPAPKYTKPTKLYNTGKNHEWRTG